MPNGIKVSFFAKIFLSIALALCILFLFFGTEYPELLSNLKKLSFNIVGLDISIWFILKGGVAFIALLSFASIFLEKVETKINATQYLTASKKTLVVKIVQTFIYAVVCIVSLDILSLDMATFTIFSGAIGVGIGFGLQKVASNFISGLILLSEKSIENNDLIELSDGTLGHVRYTGARYTLLRSDEGVEIIIPNDDLLSNRVINWTYSDKKAALKIEIRVDCEADIEKALLLMSQAALENVLISDTPLPTTNIESIHYEAVCLSLTFWLPNITENRALIKTQLFSQVIHHFKENSINLAKIDTLKPLSREGLDLKIAV